MRPLLSVLALLVAACGVDQAPSVKCHATSDKIRLQHFMDSCFASTIMQTAPLVCHERAHAAHLIWHVPCKPAR